MIRALGPHLQALHIHDTDKIHDSHQIPFSMAIDFQSIVAALKRSIIRAILPWRASYYLENYPKDEVLKGVKELAKSARKLAEMFEQEV
ncbi:MAG: hypothetical protein ACLR2E_20620 [Lachnospiraceae bacterium]